MVDPYRDHLRTRREQNPGIGATALLAEIRATGYTGSHNLLVRYSTKDDISTTTRTSRHGAPPGCC